MSIKKQLQKIRLAIGKKILDRKNQKNHKIAIEKMRKILFLRHDGKIGDYIVSSFVFRELKKQNPNLHIGVVCSTKTLYLFDQNPFIDSIYPVTTKKIRDYIKTANKIRKENYDILIDPTTFLRNRDLLLIRLINATINIGYQKSDYQLFDVNITDNNLHFSQIYQKALELIGYSNIDTRYDIPVNLASQKHINQFLTRNQLNQFITINFFGASSSRSFNDSNIKALLTDIQQKCTLPIILLTYPAVTEKLKHIIKNFHNIFIYEETKSIFDNIELIRSSYLVISPDTSIIHIASGLNKPMIAFYGDGKENFTHWHPNSQNIVHLIQYKKNINEITPQQILPEWLV